MQVGVPLLIAALIATTQQQTPRISKTDAAHVFAQARALCSKDNSKLWGVSLCVPIMLVDPKTLQAVTNRPLPGAVREGDVFRVKLKPGTPVAMAPASYAGMRWVELPWPPYGDSETRAVSLMHESFHVVQPGLGFDGDADNGSISGDPFLDTQMGRVWLRGEMHALRVALQAAGEPRRRALHDALAIRLYRQSLFAGTRKLEQQLDILEGVAEGTGIDAGLPPERRIAYALYDISYMEAQTSYARSFAYATGPAYGELLDAVQHDWRRRTTAKTDLALTAMRAYGLRVAPPTASQATAVIARYDGKAIEMQESVRARRMAAQREKYTRELVNGATMTLPMMHVDITFDPKDIEALGSYGNVYHSLRVTAPWGTITLSGGDALISSDFRRLIVAAPKRMSRNIATGDGWTLVLAKGYVMTAARQRNGSYSIQQRL